MLAGAADLSVFGAAGFAVARADQANAELSWLARRDAAAAGLGSGLSTLVAGLTVWGVLLAGVDAVGGGAISRVPLAAATLTALAAFEAVGLLPGAAMALSHAKASADRIARVRDTPSVVREPDCLADLPAGPVTVSLHDACVRYSPGGPLALDGVSLELMPGRRIALVGPNGAGKSTVAAVLLRFIELAGGSALVEGRPLAGFGSDDVRAVIGGCPQDPHLFNASIAANLRVASPAASDAELAGVIGRVGLADWMAALPEGIDTMVGENGAAVSGGQRQRLALARALLTDPRVLVLDEPTAHLDATARSALLTDMFSAIAGRATLLITHDLDGLEQVDEILVLDQGRVVERGSHAELIAAAGLYRALALTGINRASHSDIC